MFAHLAHLAHLARLAHLAHLAHLAVRAVDSYVYFGGTDGYSEARRLALPTIGASDVEVDDLDGDGWRDLVLANRHDGGSAASEDSDRVDVYAYLGGPDGFSPDRRLSLPGFGAAQTAVADLDGDAWPDLAMASGTFHSEASWVYRGGLGLPGRSGSTGAVWVYLGGPDGFDVSRRIDPPDRGLDFEAGSEVLRFGPGGRTPVAAAMLPTVSAAAVAAGDVDGDGLPEWVFANRHDAAGGAAGAVSHVYGDEGFTERVDLPVVARGCGDRRRTVTGRIVTAPALPSR